MSGTRTGVEFLLVGLSSCRGLNDWPKLRTNIKAPATARISSSNQIMKVSRLKKPVLVQKFGGTSLADLNGFEASAAVIGQYAAERRVVVVLSAVKGVTDLLLAAIDTAVDRFLKEHPEAGLG